MNKKSTMNSQDSYSFGRETGLDALEQLSMSGAGLTASLTGLLSVIMHAVYAMHTPDDQAEKIIAFCKELAEAAAAKDSAADVPISRPVPRAGGNK